MIAQAAADRFADRVCLVDLCLRSSQAVAHHTADVLPCLGDLLDAHSVVSPPAEVVRSLSWDVPSRGYSLVIGLPRARDWIRLRPFTVSRSLVGVLRAWGFVVADTDSEVEGEKESGSPDIEMRNSLARSAHLHARANFVVGRACPMGLQSLVRVLEDLVGLGVPPERLIPVVNQAPRSSAERSAVTRALAELGPPVNPPLFLSGRARIARAHLDLSRFPPTECRRLLRVAESVGARLDTDTVDAPADPDEVTIRTR